MTNSDTNENGTNIPAAQQANVLAVVLLMFGIALLVTGPTEVRLAGLCLLAAAGEAYLAGPITPRIAALTERLTNATSAIGTRLTRVLPWTVGGAGVLVALATIRSWQAWPAPLPYFYLVLSALLVAVAVFWRPDREESPTSFRISKTIGIVGAVAGAAATAGLAGLTIVYGVNIPFFDEYVATLPFILDFSGMTNAQQITELFRPHFSHRIASTRVIALAQLALLGKLDFYQLLLLSFSFLAAALLVIYGSLRSPNRNLILFAPFLLLVCHPQFHQLTLWAFSLPHFCALFFSALCFYLLSRGRGIALFVAMLSMIAAAFSFASGVLVGIIGLAYLVDQRRYAHAHIWLVPMAFTLVWYFRGIENTSPLEGLVAIARDEPGLGGKLAYMLEFLGSAATLGLFTDFWGTLHRSNSPNPQTARIAQVAGVVLLAVFAYVSVRRYWRTNLTVYGLLLLTVIAAALAADKRSGDPSTVPFLSRYALNSVLLLGLSYLALLELHTAHMKRLLPWTVTASVLFCTLSYAVTIPHVRTHSYNLKFSMLNVSNILHERPQDFMGATPLFSSATLQRTLDAGVYAIPEQQIARSLGSKTLKFTLNNATAESLPFTVLDIGENHAAYTFMLQYTAAEPTPAQLGIALIDTNAATHTFEVSSFNQLPSQPEFLAKHGPSGATHFACVPKDRLPAGPLKLALVRVARDRTDIMETSHVLQNPQTFAPALWAIGPALMHEVATYTATFADRNGQYVLPMGSDGAEVPWPVHYCIEVLVRPELPPIGNIVDIWKAGKSSDERSGIKLAVHEGHFIVFAGDGQTWHEAARLQATPNAWNWVGLSFDGTNLILMQCADIGAPGLGPLSVAAGALPQPLQQAGILQQGYPIHIHAQNTRVREFRILPALLTPDTVAAHWPIFRIE